MNELSNIELLIIMGAVVLVLVQASWIFSDAAKRGENKWMWGILGLLNVPSSLIIYLIVTRLIIKKKPCPLCGKYIIINSKYCPQCGSRIED